MSMTDMQIAEMSIPTSARLEQEQIRIVERRCKAAVIVCEVVLRRLASTGDARLNCSADTSKSENMSRMTSRQSGSEVRWGSAVMGSDCAVLLLDGVVFGVEVLDATLTGAESLKREYSLALSSTNWVVVISIAESRLDSSILIPSESCFLNR